MKQRAFIWFPVMVLLFCVIAGAQAHTELKESRPAQDSVVESAPEELVLTYGGAVNLVKLSLAHEEGDAVPINFKPSTTAAERFSVALPPLESGRYKAKWTALGGDGHVLQGSFDFTVDAR